MSDGGDKIIHSVAELEGRGARKAGSGFSVKATRAARGSSQGGRLALVSQPLRGEDPTLLTLGRALALSHPAFQSSACTCGGGWWQEGHCGNGNKTRYKSLLRLC